MKTLLKLLVLITILTSLVSCGAQKSSATFKVSSSFMMSNSGYQGGLIIRGKKSTSESFSIAIPYTAGSTSSETKIELPKGDWEFYAAGWSGSNAFEGNVYCGLSRANLSQDSATIEITVSQDNCGNGFFAGPISQLTAADAVNNSNNRIRNFILSSCGAFYDVNTNVIQNGASVAYCDDPTFPLEMRSKVKSFKIKAINKKMYGIGSDLLATSGFESQCYSNNNSAISHITPNQSIRLPTLNIPLEFEVFENVNCEQSIAIYPMLEGIEFNYPNMDKLLLTKPNSPTHYVSLHLPSNELKKGYSPFYHLMPSFKCAGNLCLPGKSGTHFYAVKNTDIKLYPKELVDCNNQVVALGPANNGFHTLLTCDDSSEDKPFLSLPILATCGGGSEICSSADSKIFEFTIDGTSSFVHIFNTYDELNTFRIGWDFLGKSLDAPEIGDHGGDNDRDIYGALSVAREMLSPNGPGGLFGTNAPLTSPNCLSVLGEKEITLFDQEEQKNQTYRVVIDNPVISAINAFFRSSESYDGSSIVDNSRDKTLMAYKLIAPGSFKLEIFMKFSCSQKAGILLDVYSDTDDPGKVREEKKLMVWNTPDSIIGKKYQRFEKYQISKEYNASNSVSRISTSVTRVMKDNNISNGSSYQINGSEYHREFVNSTDFNEYATKYFIRGELGKFAGKMIPIQRLNSTQTTNLFTDSTFATARTQVLFPGGWSVQLNPVDLATTSGSTWIDLMGVTDLSQGSLTNTINSTNPETIDLFFSNTINGSLAN